MELEAPKSSVSTESRNIRLKVSDVEKVDVRKMKINGKEIDDTIVQGLKQVTVIIEGVWNQNEITSGTIIHLVDAKYDPAQQAYCVNNSSGFVVIEPDSLLTCTLVASSLFCERKTWLNNLFLGQVGSNRAMLLGTLVHEVFQYGVKNRIADKDKLIERLDDLLDDATVMLEIYSVEVHIKEVRDEAIVYIDSVKEWIEKFLLPGPRPTLDNEPEMEIKVIGVTDIEENVWSTKYGLKGKIDVTGSVRVHNRRTNTQSDKIIPLELKTGNPNLSASHAAQVSMYSMMIEDRYAQTNQGFVIYLKNKAAMYNVALTHNIKRDLIQRRNRVNASIKNHYFGPEMLDQRRVCQGCERLTECILMSELYQPGKLDDFPTMKALEPEATGHLDAKFIAFFQNHHERISNLMMSYQTDDSFWTVASEESEERGTGFGKLQAFTKDKSVILFKRHPKHPSNSSSSCIGASNGGSSQPSVKKMKINEFFSKVVKAPDGKEVPVGKLKPFNTEANLSKFRLAISLDNDDQTMSSQNKSTAIAIGFMNEIKSDQIIVKLYDGTIDTNDPNLMYRIDKLDRRAPLDAERIVLIRLLAREDWRCERIRQLLLDHEFEPKDNAKMNLFVLSKFFDDISALSSGHQKFVVSAVATDNYYILDESTEPNKGNVDEAVAALAQIVEALGRKLLIVAPNVDDLVGLMKRLQGKRLKFNLIDDGKSTKARFKFALNLVKVVQNDKIDLARRFDMYIKQLESAPIVITSYVMSIGGLQFTRRTFDYCVCYDCDKTELLTGLSPMFCSDRFILIDIQATDNRATPSKLLSNDDDDDDDIQVIQEIRAPASAKLPNGPVATLGAHLRSVRARQKTIEAVGEDEIHMKS